MPAVGLKPDHDHVLLDERKRELSAWRRARPKSDQIVPPQVLFFKEKKEMKAKDKIKFKIKDLFYFVLSFLFSKK